MHHPVKLQMVVFTLFLFFFPFLFFGRGGGCLKKGRTICIHILKCKTPSINHQGTEPQITPLNQQQQQKSVVALKTRFKRTSQCIIHPLLIQLEELFRDFGRVHGQPQTLDIQLRDDVFKYFFERQPAGRPVSRRGWNGILQDGTTEGGQLAGKTDGEDLSSKVNSHINSYLNSVIGLGQVCFHMLTCC